MLLRNFDAVDTMGIPWSSVNLQDDWDLDEGEGGIERKWDSITAFFEETSKGTAEELFLNHISASKKDEGPCGLAKGYYTNSDLVQGLNSRLND